MGNKYFTISYDDGVSQDARIVALMKEYGIRGTFNLNSGMFGTTRNINRIVGDIGIEARGSGRRCVEASRMTVKQAREIYLGDGIEIASHGTNHRSEAKLSDAELAEEVTADAQRLSELFQTEIKGHIFPFGAYDAHTLEAMREAGITYGRGVSMFKRPKDFRFHMDSGIITPTCWHLDRFTKDCLTEFLEAPTQEYPQVFYMWGHGYELDYGTKRGNDTYLESLFRMVSRAENVLCVTNRELVEILANQRG